MISTTGPHTTPLAPPTPGAGGVVLRGGKEGHAVLLVRYRSGQWAFPKGHLEAGETAQQAAVREVQEEGGVLARIVAPLSLTRYTNDRGEAREIAWFLMLAEDNQLEGIIEDTFSEGGFMAVSEAREQLAFEPDRALLAEALRLMETR